MAVFEILKGYGLNRKYKSQYRYKRQQVLQNNTYNRPYIGRKAHQETVLWKIQV